MKPLSFQNSIEEIQKHICETDQFFVDAGNTGAFVTHGLQTFGSSLFYISLGMGGMGNSIGAAIGACFANRKRSFIFVGDGSFLMHGLEVHTAIEHDLPLVIVIFNNNAHGMCATREDLFLGAKSGINQFKKSFFGDGFKSLFPSLNAFEVNSTSELVDSLRALPNLSGPCLISINLGLNEMPPFKTFVKKELNYART